MEEQKVKRGRGRPKKDERYMKETVSWNVRVRKKLLKRFKEVLRKKKVFFKEKVYANTLVTEILEAYVSEQEKKIAEDWQKQCESNLKKAQEEMETLWRLNNG